MNINETIEYLAHRLATEVLSKSERDELEQELDEYRFMLKERDRE